MYNEDTETLGEDDRIVLAMFTEDKNMAVELSKGDAVLKEFEKDVELTMQDDDLKEAYDHFLDYGDGMREDGFKDGLEQSERQALIATTKRLLALDYSVEEIQKITTLSIEEIETIKANLNEGNL